MCENETGVFAKLIEGIRSECGGGQERINEVIRAAVSTSSEKQVKYISFARDMELLASRAMAIAFIEYPTKNQKFKAVSSFKKEVSDIIHKNKEMLTLNWHKQLYFLLNLNS
ncbi:MAG: hypothetical protein ACTSX1_11830 [Candidatus Heimdallarchaeaceae archaeon]